MSEEIIRCKIDNPSLKRALDLVPPKFTEGYEWFIKNQGKVIGGLPFGKNTPAEVSYPLAREAGIHSPAKTKMHYRDKRYALSVHSSNTARYDDGDPLVVDNGTWHFRYCAQDNASSTKGQDFNGWLMNCLEDGVPVGVITRTPGVGCIVRGLAFIESYEPTTRMFTMRGPIGSLEELRGEEPSANVEEEARAREEEPTLKTVPQETAAEEDVSERTKPTLISRLFGKLKNKR